MNDSASEVEEVIEISTPIDQNTEASLNGPWDDASLDVEERKDLLSKEIERLENKSIVSTYAVRGGIDVADEIKKYIHDRIKWRFTDAFIVTGVYTEIEKAIKDCRKTGVFGISGLYIEPLLQLLQSAEGIGYESAKRFYDKILVPVSETVNVYRKESQVLNNLRLKLGSLENNIDPNSIEEAESKETNQE